ncbi:hypothetical protein ACFWB1_21330 [Streptomyces goshikiensis]|uniref:hypothetical protein n=1 Tax=Streptomyces TaxID=1883 RepID=UPI000F3AA5D3|nr:hypothetical protein [Streptomyces sp. ADI95-16]AYV32849.1 hypothetical protein EES41_39445 [Streptomyces sp. ADI95-16]
MTHRPAVFAALLGLTRAGSAIGDFWVNAARIVSSMSRVSVPRLAAGGSGFLLQSTGVAIVRRHGLASRFALVGGR